MQAAGAALVAAALAACASPEPPPEWKGPRVGIVVLHAEGEDPYGHTLRFTRTMQREGFLTDSPEMPWSARRAFDTGVAGAVKEIDASVARLKSRGAQKIFVAGQSLGAAAAVRYATLRRVDGLIAFGPRNSAEAPAKAGEGSSRAQGEFFDPKGAMSVGKNAAGVRSGTPVLWVVGDTEEAGLKKAGQAAFDALPRSPPPKLVELSTGRLDTPDLAGAACASWIREIAVK